MIAQSFKIHLLCNFMMCLIFLHGQGHPVSHHHNFEHVYFEYGIRVDILNDVLYVL